MLGPIQPTVLWARRAPARRTFATGLGREAARRGHRDARLLLVDLRGHGASSRLRGFHPPHTLEAAADDVAELLVHKLGGGGSAGVAPHLLVGLSLGGKVALALLRRAAEGAAAAGAGQAPHAAAPVGTVASAAHPGSEAPVPGLPQQVWVLDSQPGTVPLDDDAPTSVNRILQLIHSIPLPVPNRPWLYAFLEERGIEQAVAWWLGSSLVAGPSADPSEGLVWGFDTTVCAALYQSYRLSSYYDVLERPPPGTVVHIVRGERSDRWTPAMLERLQQAHSTWEAARAAPAAAAVGELRYHVLAKAGHWLQADNPVGLNQMMSPWFKEIGPHRAST